MSNRHKRTAKIKSYNGVPGQIINIEICFMKTFSKFIILTGDK